MKDSISPIPSASQKNLSLKLLCKGCKELDYSAASTNNGNKEFNLYENTETE